MNPFQKNSGMLMSEDDIKKYIKDIMIPLLINKDLSISDASITSSIDSLKESLLEVMEKLKTEKIYNWHTPFYIRVPKVNKYPVTVEVDGIDASNRSISFGFKIPSSFFSNDDNIPHIIYANKYSIKLVKKISYDKNVADSTLNNVFILECPEIGSGTITTRCIDSEVREYKIDDDVPNITLAPATKVLELAPDIAIEDIEHPEQLLRTRSDVDYIDFITTAMMMSKTFTNSLDDRTAYFTRDDKEADNLTFKFNTLEEAKTQLPAIYSKIPELWRNITVEFADTVTDISGLFEGVDHTDTVGNIVGRNITTANNLYKNSKITYISPTLLNGLTRLENLNEAFANNKKLTSVPKAEDLFMYNKRLKSATGLFEDSGLKEDPLYWKYSNADLTGYIKKSLEDPIGPVPYQGYALNRPYPATYDVNNWVFKDVSAFNEYYKNNKMRAYKSNDTIEQNDLSKFSITIVDGDLDEMFMGTTIVKLPKLIEAPKATSANRFAKEVTTLVNTDTIGNIFTKCPKLEYVVEAFSGCTGLTAGFEFLGASDTISNYSKVFENCTNIDKDTLPYPWRWNGLDGYPDNIVGIDGFKNIPNLPNWVPKEWGGPGTESDPNVHTGSKSPIPVITSCYIGDDSFSISFTDLRAGDVIEIAMVDADERFKVLGDVKRIYASLGAVGMSFGISDITADGHTRLLDTDCIRIRVREQKRNPIKLWSDYIYQVPQLRLTALNPTVSNASIIGFMTDGEV